MVYVRKTKRIRKKKKTYTKYKPIMQATRPLANHQMLKFRYCETISINPGAGVIGGYTFRANSLFDPNYSGTGHQPMGFDQWVPTFYNHFVVLGAKITAKFISPGSDAQLNTYVVGIDLHDSTSSISGWSTERIMEHPKVKHSILTNSTAKATTTVTKNFSASKFFRIKDIKGSPDHRGNSFSNPAEDAIFHVFCGAADAFSDGQNMNVIVTIDYIADLQEPNELSQS
ncbi:MAG: putative capsid protein [Circoviridae sp.]|nr:MAG: putative capsid protein [Circoviridae sp.]